MNATADTITNDQIRALLASYPNAPGGADGYRDMDEFEFERQMCETALNVLLATPNTRMVYK